jgi:hypothetical protein
MGHARLDLVVQVHATALVALIQDAKGWVAFRFDFKPMGLPRVTCIRPRARGPAETARERAKKRGGERRSPPRDVTTLRYCTFSCQTPWPWVPA